MWSFSVFVSVFVQHWLPSLTQCATMIITALCFVLAASTAGSAVLDPALYLIPSPPLAEARNSIPPGEMWGRSLEERIVRDVNEEDNNDDTTEKVSASPGAGESRMFWPRFNSPEPVLGVTIPLTFSLSGSYGKPASIPTSVIGNTYTNVGGVGTRVGSTLFGKSGVASIYGSYGRSALAGSSYGSYGSGVRVYGGDNVASWSGWGNGKWGHYGKG